MKNKIYFATVLALFCLAALTSCDKNPVQPYETVSGKVTDTDGNPLKGIQITKYLDQELKDKTDVTKTVEDGTFYMNENSFYVDEEDTVTIYLKAEDPKGIYLSKTVPAQMIYSKETTIGQAKADIVLEKK